MSSWHSYTSIFNLGHKAVQDLLLGPVIVEEKVDGSQFSFGKFHTPATTIDGDGVEHNYELKIRSKGQEMVVEEPEKMFTLGAATVRRLGPDLHPGWTYRAEFLQKPKHNTLCYDRPPVGNIVIFDINTDDEAYLSYEEKKAEADRLGLEVVPKLYEGIVGDIEGFRNLLDTISFLGGQKIEGVVIKPQKYDLFGRDKKCLMGKFVNEAYKELHKMTWKADNPTGGDILAILGAAVKSNARWEKAIQHLRDDGVLENSPRDIGLLMRAIPEDIKKECEEMIKEKLFGWAWPHLRRMSTSGFPEFYKNKLLEKQFEGVENVAVVSEV